MQDPRFWIVSNWKMNVGWSQAQALWAVAEQHATESLAIIVCAPHPWLMSLEESDSSFLFKGAQDLHHKTHGAHTGDVSAAMLETCGVSYVLVGHSERRHDHHETDAMCRGKILRAWEHHITPILCVGEQDGEDRSEVIERQLQAWPHDDPSQPMIIAYEPCWAIGTGQVPTNRHIQDTCDHIRTWAKVHRQSTPLCFYGGSVSAETAPSLRPLCDGFLVGGQSQDPTAFSCLSDRIAGQV